MLHPSQFPSLLETMECFRFLPFFWFGFTSWSAGLVIMGCLTPIRITSRDLLLPNDMNTIHIVAALRNGP